MLDTPRTSLLSGTGTVGSPDLRHQARVGRIKRNVRNQTICTAMFIAVLCFSIIIIALQTTQTEILSNQTGHSIKSLVKYLEKEGAECDVQSTAYRKKIGDLDRDWVCTLLYANDTDGVAHKQTQSCSCTTVLRPLRAHCGLWFNLAIWRKTSHTAKVTKCPWIPAGVLLCFYVRPHPRPPLPSFAPRTHRSRTPFRAGSGLVGTAFGHCHARHVLMRARGREGGWGGSTRNGPHDVT